jgi:hypothetical protein
MNLRGQPVDATVGQRMIDLLCHRGSDGSGRLIRKAAMSSRTPSVFL